MTPTQQLGRGPFAVCALSPQLRGAVIEPSVEQAARRAVRALRQAGAAHLAECLPQNRTRFDVEKRLSYAVRVPDSGLMIALCWLHVDVGDQEYPEPTIVAVRDQGGEPGAPVLMPDGDRANAYACTLTNRGLERNAILVLPAHDRRDAGLAGRWVPTMGDALGSHTVIEAVVRAAMAELRGPAAPSGVAR